MARADPVMASEICERNRLRGRHIRCRIYPDSYQLLEMRDVARDVPRFYQRWDFAGSGIIRCLNVPKVRPVAWKARGQSDWSRLSRSEVTHER